MGKWQYDGFIMDGQRYSNPNPELSVVFTFAPDHTATLYWKRADESGFCERHGTWDLDQDILKQTVTWLNPANDSSCAQDPDMQLYRTTENQVALAGQELDLHMSVNGGDFIYILAPAN